MKNFKHRLIAFGISFCMLLQIVSPSILEAMDIQGHVIAMQPDIVGEEASTDTTSEEITTEQTIEAAIEETTVEVPVTEPLSGESTESSSVSTIDSQAGLPNPKTPKASYYATIDLANAASLAQTGLGYMVSGTTSPNRILIFSSVAAGKSYRIIQTGTSRVDGISVSVLAGQSTHITLAGINLTRPRIDGSGTLEGSAFSITSGNCTIELEGSTTNVLKTTVSMLNNVNLTALTVALGTSLTIEGSGKLEATSYSWKPDETVKGFIQSSAGIGGNLKGGGDITINSGTIIAKGDFYGAGIGSSMESTMNGITINGGTITATGGEEAAGIGTGRRATLKKSILITGGTIVANAGHGGAGIGTGFRQEEETANVYIDSIIIRGGNIKANASTSGVGIGAANYGRVNLIDISGGDIEAKAGLFAAGIGSGFHAITGDINISGGTIVASAISCGIGAGGPASEVGNIIISGNNTVIDASAMTAPGVGIGAARNAFIDEILITGGKKITATGAGSASGASSAGSGIGAVQIATINKIKITGGTIVAKGAPDSTAFGVGIGSANNGDDETKTAMESITITGGTIEAVGGQSGAGIGAAVGNGIRDGLRNITIKSGNITATGGANGPGIGILSSREPSVIIIEGGVIKATGGEGAAGIGTGISTHVTRLESIKIEDGTITAIGGKDGVGIGWAQEKNDNSTVGQVEINGGNVNATANQNHGVGIGMGWQSDGPVIEWGAGVIIRGGTVVATGTDAGIGSRYNSNIVNIVFLGGNTTASGGTVVDNGVVTKGPGIGYVYQTDDVPGAPLLTTNKEATIRAFSTGTTIVNGTEGTNISPAYRVGTHMGTAYLMNFQIRDSRADQAIHDVYIKSDDPSYKGPLRNNNNDFYSFAYSTGGAPQTHSHQLIADGSDGSTKLGQFYEQNTDTTTFTSVARNPKVTILELEIFPTADVALTPDRDLIASGEIVTWTLKVKNTSANAPINNLTFTPNFASVGMQLVSGTIKKDGQTMTDQFLQGGTAISSLGIGQETTVTFKTIVNGVINQERILSVGVGAKSIDPWYAKGKVYIKNLDANYPEWALGLGLWSVPKEFNFGYIDITNTPTSASLNPSDYQSYTQSGGFYTRVYEKDASTSQGWKLKVALGQFENEQSPAHILGEGTRLEITTTLKQVVAPNQNPEMIGEPLGTNPPVLTNSQLNLYPGAPAMTIISTDVGADVGTWDLNIPVNAVKLFIPLADAGMQGSYYQSQLTWSLEIGP